MRYEIRLNDFLDCGFYEVVPGLLRMRVHDIMYAEIDRFQFLTVICKHDLTRMRSPEDRITLPTPIRTREQFNAMKLLLGG